MKSGLDRLSKINNLQRDSLIAGVENDSEKMEEIEKGFTVIVYEGTDQENRISPKDYYGLKLLKSYGI